MREWNSASIKALRKSLEETQDEFAAHFRVTVESVRVWEQDKGFPSGPATVILDQLAYEASLAAS